jgi:hypothetical protein
MSQPKGASGDAAGSLGAEWMLILHLYAHCGPMTISFAGEYQIIWGDSGSVFPSDLALRRIHVYPCVP